MFTKTVSMLGNKTSLIRFKEKNHVVHILQLQWIKPKNQ